MTGNFVPAGKTVEVQAESPEDQHATLSMEGGQRYSYDLAMLFEFRTDLSNALSSHAAHQQFWETLASDLIFRAREFEEQGYAKWWAHSRRYARFYMKSSGQKETVDNLKDAVVNIFGEDVNEEQFGVYAARSWRGFMLEEHGTEAQVNKVISAGKAVPFAPFIGDMRVYLDSGWTYERIMSTFRQLEEQAKRVTSIAAVMNDRSFKMKEFADLERAKMGNVGPLAIDELVSRVASVLLPKLKIGEPGTIGAASFDEKQAMEDFSRQVRPNKNK